MTIYLVEDKIEEYDGYHVTYNYSIDYSAGYFLTRAEAEAKIQEKYILDIQYDRAEYHEESVKAYKRSVEQNAKDVVLHKAGLSSDITPILDIREYKMPDLDEWIESASYTYHVVELENYAE